MNKVLKKTLISFFSVILFLGLVLGCAIGYFRLSVSDYYKNSEKAFVIPALNDGYVPQGFCFDERSSSFVMTGFMSNNKPSPIHMVSKETGENIKTVWLKKPSGEDYIGHCGGMKIWKDYVYIADGSEPLVYAFSYNDLINAENEQSITSIGSFSTKAQDDSFIIPAFIEIQDDKIIIGEFYREESYPTPESHHLTTTSGEQNKSLALVFNLDANYHLGINPNLISVYSICEKVQGATIHNGKIYLSTSWGVDFSTIRIYDLSKASKSTIDFFGKTDLPLTYIDNSCLVKDLKIAPMSEELVFVDNNLYILIESASNKYIFGKFTGGQWMYATDLEKYNSK